MSSLDTPKTIILRSSTFPFTKEKKAGGTITPGDILERSAGTFLRQSTAAAYGAPLVAIENDGAGGGINDDYSADDNVIAVALKLGEEAYCFVAAAAAAIVEGDLLELDGAGGVRILAAGVAVFTALEAVDNSGGGAKARIRVEKI